MEYGNFLSIELAKELKKHLNISKLVQCYSYVSFGVEVSEPILTNKHYKENNKIYLKIETNIYELEHKCKEWAWDKGYILNSGKSVSSGWIAQLYYIDNENVSDDEFGEDGFIQNFYQRGKNENCVFNACEWILKK